MTDAWRGSHEKMYTVLSRIRTHDHWITMQGKGSTDWATYIHRPKATSQETGLGNISLLHFHTKFDSEKQNSMSSLSLSIMYSVHFQLYNKPCSYNLPLMFVFVVNLGHARQLPLPSYFTTPEFIYFQVIPYLSTVILYTCSDTFPPGNAGL